MLFVQRRPRLCSINCAGLGNRLKSYWGARRQDPNAVLMWNRTRLWASTAKNPLLEKFSELFENNVCVRNSNAFRQYSDWRLFALPEEGQLDFRYNDMPASAVSAYLPIVQSMKPTQRIVDIVGDAQLDFSDKMTGIHFRSKFDDINIQHKPTTDQIETILKRRPCFMATECRELRSTLKGVDGVVMIDLNENDLVRGDYTHAIAEALLLASCNELYFNKQTSSTFAEIAWWFGGAKQKVTFY